MPRLGYDSCEAAQEQWRAEGEANVVVKGKEEGLAEGHEKGAAEWRAESCDECRDECRDEVRSYEGSRMLTTVIEIRFGTMPAREQNRSGDASLEELES